jgi:uncharacterized protein (UPF0276 family)
MENAASRIPPGPGIGLKAEHYRAILQQKPPLAFFEIHAENYMGAGGPPHRYLAEIRRDYPLSLHGVGLSIGGEKPLERGHLARLKALCERYQPGLFSEHLAWSTHDTGYMSDLLPLPYTAETLARVCEHIDETQAYLGRQMLLENPSSYVSFAESTYAEAQFIAEIVHRTGCVLLLDVNNVLVSAANLGTDPQAYLDQYPLDHVKEIHLAGHDVMPEEDGGTVLIDAHGSPVADPVWELYAGVIARTGPLPSLIERDNNLPPLDELLAEARRAGHVLSAMKEAA